MNYPWKAQWIWTADVDRHPRHQAVVARRRFTLASIASATLRLSADTRYRLWINGVWVTDGPGRSWPAHHRFDHFDATPFLVNGENVIAVEVLHVGFATMQSVPQEAALLVQLDVSDVRGRITTIASDATWCIRPVAGLRADTARMMITMEAVEWRDLRADPDDLISLACDEASWPQATAWHAAEGGPWGDLQPREVPQEIRIPRFPVAVVEALQVERAAFQVGFDLKALCYAQDRTANFARIMGVMATVMVSTRAQTLRIVSPIPGELTLRVGGELVHAGELHVRRGDNLVTIAALGEGHLYDTVFGFETWDGITLRHPWSASELPWLWIGPFAPLVEPIDNATHTTRSVPQPEATALVTSLASAPNALRLRELTSSTPTQSAILRVDPWVDFRSRVISGVLPPVDLAPLTGSGVSAVALAPTTQGDREYCLDLGLVSVGYVALDCTAAAGTVIDVMLVEHRLDDGRPQHTDGHRNGLRVICRAGRNRFVSRRRRGGRFMYVIIRESRAAITLHDVHLVEARYPTVEHGSFRCTDPHLTRIWQIGARTLALCMEDTYTDCPLYEQVLWVGDLRHEALGAHDAFGSYDLTLRSLRLAAESLDGLPMPGSQVPSGWNVLLPAWSLLWVQAVDEFAWHSGDRKGATDLWPAVERTLRYALSCCATNEQGLMTIHAWNFLDWTGIDTDSDTVLHNSLLLCGAIQAARRLARWLGKKVAWLERGEDNIRLALHHSWDRRLGGWPDAIRANGVPSTSTCQHTAALGLSYDVLPHASARRAALGALLAPPEGLVQVGSPFALHFILEALIASGKVAEAVAIMRERWGPMVDAGASTCWETFPGWEKDKPTRSHCHGWSAGPVHLLLKTVLGVSPTAHGWTSALISPHPVNGLTQASGAVATPHGPLRVSWQRTDSTLTLTITAPATVHWTVARNPDWRGIRRITVNGTTWRQGA